MEIQNTDLPVSSPVETPKEFYIWDFNNLEIKPTPKKEVMQPTPKKEVMQPEDYTKY